MWYNTTGTCRENKIEKWVSPQKNQHAVSQSIFKIPMLWLSRQVVLDQVAKLRYQGEICSYAYIWPSVQI